MPTWFKLITSLALHTEICLQERGQENRKKYKRNDFNDERKYKQNIF